MRANSSFAWFIAASGESWPLLAFERKMPKLFSISFHIGVRGRGRAVSSDFNCTGYDGYFACNSGSLKTLRRVGGLPRSADWRICSGLVAHSKKSNAVL